jgi:hypothetical protein
MLISNNLVREESLDGVDFHKSMRDSVRFTIRSQLKMREYR